MSAAAVYLNLNNLKSEDVLLKLLSNMKNQLIDTNLPGNVW